MEKKNPNTVLEKRQTFNGLIFSSDSILNPIAQRAKRYPKEKFNNLLHHVNLNRVRKSISKIPAKSASGPDKINRAQALKHLDWLLPKDLETIHNGCYKAPPSRRVYIPKGNGDKRPLAIGNITDRGIQGATSEVLSHIYEQDFLKCSFGFRPGRSAHNALATVEHAVMNEHLTYILEVDLKNFFGTLNHGWMMRFLRHRISDERVLKLIESWLKSGVLEDGVLVKSQDGTVQGGAISPLLANVYLHYALDLWFEKKIKPRLRGRARLIRYADDFIVAFEYQSDCLEFKPLMETRLGEFGLLLSKEKTHVTILGLRKRNDEADRRHISFLGFTIYMCPTRKGVRNKLVFKTDRKKLSKAKTNMRDSLWELMHAGAAQQAKLLNAILRGHFGYYGMAGNSNSLQTFHYLAICVWRKTLSRRSQNGNVTWEKMESLISKYKIVKPRIKIGYFQLSSYAIV